VAFANSRAASNLFYRNLVFTPGLHLSPGGKDVVRPYGAAAWDYATLYRLYEQSADDALDIAVVILKDSIGDAAGWLQMKPLDTAALSPVTLTIAGEYMTGTHVWICSRGQQQKVVGRDQCSASGVTLAELACMHS
jgi:hypothetical protein